MVDLFLRYDGPIPWWEDSARQAHQAEGWRRFCRTERRLAMDFARAGLIAVQRANLCTGAARVRHWMDAERLVRAARQHRDRHVGALRSVR